MQDRNNWKVEKDTVLILSKEGKTLQEIGDMYGVSKEQIRQVLARYFPDLERTERGASLKARKKKQVYQASLQEKYIRPGWVHETDLARAMSRCFTRKKQNAKNSKWSWEITKQDVVFPMVCPILGITIDWFTEYRTDNSPSFDRIDPTKGYIPGNVVICSWRANRIKNNGTAEEHEKIALFLRQHNLP